MIEFFFSFISQDKREWLQLHIANHRIKVAHHGRMKWLVLISSSVK